MFFCPSGIVVLVECLTDNVNRTGSNIKSYYTKGNGNLGTTGCVSFMFDHKGVLVIDRDEDLTVDEEELEMLVIEAGGEDFVVEDTHFEIITAIEDFGTVRDALSREGHEFAMSELRYLPQTMTELTELGDLKSMQKLVDLLEEGDDIQNVYHKCDETE